VIIPNLGNAELLFFALHFYLIKYDKHDQQGKAAFNERNPHMTQQQVPMARSPGGPQSKTEQGKDRART
jgi:hypothetical protein